MLAGDPLEPPRRLAQLRQRRRRSRRTGSSSAPRSSSIRAAAFMSARSALSALLLALLDAERVDLGDREVEPFAVAVGLVERAARARRARRARRQLGPRRARPRRVDPAEAVEQGAVAPRVEQAAIVMLAVDLDQPGAGSRSVPAGTAVVDEGAAAAVGLQRPAQEQRLARLGLDALLGEQHDASDDRRRARTRRDTTACACPARTSPLSARCPSARPSASSRIDLPAPVSPVSTPRPGRIRGRAPRSARHRGWKVAAAPAPRLALSPAARCAGSACSAVRTIRCPDSWRRAPPRPSRASSGMPSAR